MSANDELYCPENPEAHELDFRYRALILQSQMFCKNIKRSHPQTADVVELFEKTLILNRDGGSPNVKEKAPTS